MPFVFRTRVAAETPEVRPPYHVGVHPWSETQESGTGPGHREGGGRKMAVWCTVMYGRPLRCEEDLTFLAVWSGTIMYPARLGGADHCWP
jgi:hypothetical protein